jgi:hypothetical protein
MKKIMFCVICVVVLAAGALSGCNKSYGLGEYNFTHVHIGDGENGHCATIKKCHDNESGIELKTEEFGSIYCSEGTYILFEDGSNCPFCE